MHHDQSPHRHPRHDEARAQAHGAGISLNRLAFTATAHCLSGCATGEVLGLVIGTALNWTNGPTIGLAVVLAFAFGYAFTMVPLLKAGLAFGAVMKLALAADTASILIMEIVDNAFMLAVPGAMSAGLGSGLFWTSLAAALLIAGAAAFPVNRWLIARGKGHAVVHEHHRHQGDPMNDHGGHTMRGSYKALGIELAVDFAIMYFVMYSMIAALDHLLLNINNVYMTLMMVAPMTVVMLVGMRSMFQSQRLNLIIGAAAVVVFLASLTAMRTQAGVGDAEFLRSMIPHHSGAILMCERASLRDPEIVALCQQILESQKQEIARMEAILMRY